MFCGLCDAAACDPLMPLLIFSFMGQCEWGTGLKNPDIHQKSARLYELTMDPGGGGVGG